MISNHNSKRNELINTYPKKNKKQNQFTGIKKNSPTKINFQSINGLITSIVIEKNDKNKITTIPKINSIHFGDDIRQ